MKPRFGNSVNVTKIICDERLQITQFNGKQITTQLKESGRYYKSTVLVSFTLKLLKLLYKQATNAATP